MQRWRHSGNEREEGDWILLTLSVENNEAGYESACRQLAAVTKSSYDFLDLGDGERADYYRVDVQVGSDRLPERSFFQNAVIFEKLRPLISEYVDNVNQVEGAWQDEYHPAGSYAIAELALADIAYVPQLARLLFRWDMGHETYHCTLISLIFRKYGCTPETMQLLAARVGADGQHADDDVWRAFDLPGFKEAFDMEEFARYLCAYSSEIQVWRLEAFAGIFAMYDRGAYRQTMRAFANAFIKSRELQEIANELENEPESDLENEIPDEFEEGSEIDEAGDSQTKFGDDWNASFEGISVGVIDPAKLSALPLAGY